MPQHAEKSSAEYYDKANQAIETALDINPNLGEAYATLGAVRHELFEYEDAERAFKVAVERAPRYPTTYHWYGFLLYDMARQEEAHDMLSRAVRQDPLSSILNYAVASNLLAMGRVDEAEAGFRAVIDADPEFAWAYEGMGELNWNGRGRLDTAADWYKTAVRYDPDSSIH